MLTAQLVRAVFLAAFVIETVFERALAVLNARHVRVNARAIPAPLADALDPETHRKSIDYTLARATFGHVSAIEGAAVSLVFLFSGVLPWLSARAAELNVNDYIKGAILFFAFGALSALIATPLDLYGTFVLESRFGFNKTSLKMWLLDRVKGAVLGVLIGGPFILAILWLTLNSGAFWWLWAALFMIAFQFLMMVLYPAVISPLFNKFTPLEEGALKEKLNELARRCGFAVGGIFVMDGSSRSAHSNAYFAGIGSSRRIVLYDTLVQHLSVDELAAVLAHEIGHYKLRHIPKGLVLGCVMTLCGFYVLSLVLHWPVIYEAFGGGTWPVDSHTPLGVAQGFIICSMIAGPLTFWSGPLFNALSRAHEYQADAYAAAHTAAAPMRGALLKLHENNLSNPTPHPWFSAYHYSHPALLERLEALK